MTGGQVAAGLLELDVQGGDINTSGDIRTGGTIRLDASGNLSNIGTLTLSGPIKTAALTVGAEMVYVRGTGNNNSAARLVKVGKADEVLAKRARKAA